MSKLMQLMKPLAAIGVLMAAAGAAHAVPSYGNLATPGVFFGTGNTNGNFTIDTVNGVEVGLRAKTFKGAQIVGADGVYHSNSGKSTLGNRAVWNYEFSVNSGAADLGDYVSMLGVDDDVSAGKNFHYVNVMDLDNEFMSGPTFHSAQNSQNIIWGAPGAAFNINSPGMYSFSLTAYKATDMSRVASTEILVQVPEPASMAMMGLGLLGLAFARRRRAK